MKKKYKALMLDLDGTSIPNRKDGMPTQRVKDAIAAARIKTHVGIATSRPFFTMHDLIPEFSLSGPSIVHSGAQIMDITTGEIYRTYEIPSINLQKIYAVAKKMGLSLDIEESSGSVPATIERTKRRSLGGFVSNIRSEKKADAFCRELAKIPDVAAHKIVSWKKGGIDVTIGHAQATKQHAIFEVAKILGIETHEIIGVGDGYNDYPLLMACGFKIAMGNAVPELKAIADFIAPSVDQDGVATIIEKFILS